MSHEEQKQAVEYDNLHQMWDASHENKSVVFQLRSSLLLKKIPPDGKGKTALDAGCGTGFYSRILLDRGFTVDAFDLSNYAIDNITSNLSTENKERFFPEVSDVFSYTQKHAPYSVIILSEVLEHLNEDHKALVKIAGLLSDDGFLIITVPTGPELYSADDELSGHVRRYTKSELKQLLNDSALNIVEFRKYGFPMIYLYLLCKRFLLKKENIQNMAKTGSPMTFKRRLFGFISTSLVFIDRLFLWTNLGVGVVIKAGKK